MGCPVLCVILLSSLLCLYGVQTQDLRERDALCSEDGCYVLYFQRKIFLDAWRSCRENGGNLATIRHQKEAAMVKELFSNVELRQHHRGKANIWIGLQRQPRQCSPTRPLRGFSWITGDQDTQYTNWLQEDLASTCSSPRCVVMPYNTAAHEQGHNLKWKDGPCSISLDGYLCRYNFRGMCTAIASEGGGNTLYSTPFNLLSTLLTHIPYGSVAAVPCPAKDDQSVLCTQKEDGTVGWNREPLFCADMPKTSWCDKDNGGCHHFCVEDDSHYYCDCNDGFLLAEDGACSHSASDKQLGKDFSSRLFKGKCWSISWTLLIPHSTDASFKFSSALGERMDRFMLCIPKSVRHHWLSCASACV